MKKLHKSQIISKLVVLKLLRTIALLMRNFITNFVRILGICKDFAGNRVNEPRLFHLKMRRGFENPAIL